MLKAEDNDILTRVSRGTPMGDLMRRFWIPFLIDTEVEPDGAPVRVKLLGESLLAFRNTDGNVGLIAEHCAHRRASLFFGRNEDCGIRCIYHGWKYDIEGKCVDLPSEPATSDFKSRVSITAYPVRAHGGMLWTFMGPDPSSAVLPQFEWTNVPREHRYFSRWQQECNYAQCVEGEIDSSHVSALHQVLHAKEDYHPTSIWGTSMRTDTAPSWKVDETPYGVALGARRDAAGGASLWRVNHFLMPFYTMIAPEVGRFINMRMWVPADDEHTWGIGVSYRPDKPLTEDDVYQLDSGPLSPYIPLIPGTMRPIYNADNDYMIDRQKQKTETYSGIPGTRAQDSAVIESAGAIADRTLERLGTSDTAIIAMRRVAINAAKELRDAGVVPAATRDGSVYNIRSHSAIMPGGVDFDDDPEFLRGMKMDRRPRELVATEPGR